MRAPSTLSPIAAPLSAIALLTCPAAAQTGAPDSFVNWETPHVHPLELTPDGTRLLAVNLADNRLEVFDVTGPLPAPLFSVPVGLDPVSVRARTSNEIWVVNHVSDSVSIVDLARQNVVATLETDDEPADVVFTSSPERAFVSCSQANTVLVFDPADLTQAPTRLQIEGEDPRALAVDATGTEVYLAVFESGNGTTILGGGATQTDEIVPPNVVNDRNGPYGGFNPPPNVEGALSIRPWARRIDPTTLYEPPLTPGLPTPPRVGLILKRDPGGVWRDDNGADWTEIVSGSQAARSGRIPGWTLLDHDLVKIDAGSLAISYVDGLMNICMALGVNPADGSVTVIGTDATNEIRFEPNLTGTFVRTKLAFVDPTGVSAPNVLDANPHLDYTTGTVDQATRDLSLADPRAIVWNQNGSRAYVAGMGSNNVVVIDNSGTRTTATPIEVREGPTGLALSADGQRLYVLNKFHASISVVDTGLNVESGLVPFFDPTPAAIKTGRKHLYDAHETSGLGITACASCHVDARIDNLSWDLGNPAGFVKALDEQNLGAGIPGLEGGFEDWHPMKGPMTTQTLQDIIGKEPLHWRGDKDGLEEFNGAFEGLQGDDEQLDPQEMQEYEDFLASIYFPPNPNRVFDNSLPTDLPLPGHFTTGRFGPGELPMPNGNAQLGLQQYITRVGVANGSGCVRCHNLPIGIGVDAFFNGDEFEDIPEGPNGERHHSLRAGGNTNATMKIPQLRNLFEKSGFNLRQPTSTAGFGFIHDGSLDSIERVLDVVAIGAQSDQDLADLLAFLKCLSGSDLPSGSVDDPQFPPGTASQDTHAAVGKQTTVVDPFGMSPQQITKINAIMALADADDVDLIVRGRRDGIQRGWLYLGNDRFQSDRSTEVHTKAQLILGVGPGNELTFTVVPLGTGVRIALDRDGDRIYDRDELDAGTDPANRRSRPKIRRGPAVRIR